MGMKNVAKHARKMKHKKVEWRKGQSGMSNPTTTKHRLAAKRNAKKSALTVESLRKFNEHSGKHTLPSAEERIDEIENQSAANSMKESVISWATCASDVTVRSFQGLFDKFEQSGKHRDAIAMVAACSEVLRSRNLALNETGYFAVLLSNVNTISATLESQQKDDEPDVKSRGSLRTALFLLRILVKRIRREVLRARFPRYAAVLRRAFGVLQDAETGVELLAVSRHLVEAQGATQQTSWFLERFCALLSSETHRKSAGNALTALLRASEVFGVAVVALFAAKLRTVDADSCADSASGALNLVSLAARFGDAMNAAALRRLAEALLSVARRDPRRFAAPVCDTFARLFAAAPRPGAAPLQLTAKLLTALLDAVHTPSPAAVRARLGALRFALLHLARLAIEQLRSPDEERPFELLAAHMQRAFETGLKELVSCENKAQQPASELCSSVLARLADVIALVNEPNVTLPSTLLAQVESLSCELLSRLNSTITLQSVASWRVLFNLICEAMRNLLPQAQILKAASEGEEQQSSPSSTKVLQLESCNNFQLSLVETLRRLAALRENAALAARDGGDGETVTTIDECLAEALRRCDVRTVWRAVRVQLRFAPRFSLSNDWLVPLLVTHARRWSLEFWHTELLPLATSCNENLLKVDPNGEEASSMRTFVEQVWLLLGCASTAEDVDALRSLGKLMADRLREATEVLVVPEAHRTAMQTHRVTLGLSTLSALRKLISVALRRRNTSTSSQLPDILQRYAKNYLPMLFNIITTESPNEMVETSNVTATLSGLQLAALETVRSYASILPSDQLAEFFDKACQKVDECPESNPFRKHALLDLLVAMCSRVDESRAEKLLSRALTALQDESAADSDSRTVKKHYRLLETVCERVDFVNSSQRVVAVRTFVLVNLRGAAPGVVKPRLKLLAKLINIDTDCLRSLQLSQSANVQQVLLEAESFVDACFPETVLCLSASSPSVRHLAEAILHAIFNRLLLTAVTPDRAVAELIHRLFALLGAVGGSEQLQVASIRAFSLALEHGRSASADYDSLVASIFDALCALVASATRAPVVRAALDLADLVVKQAPDWPSVAALFDSCFLRLVLCVPPACLRVVRFAIKRIFERVMRKAHDVHVAERSLRRLEPARLGDFDKLLRNCRKRIERAWRKRAAAENESATSDSDASQADVVSKSEMRSRTAVSAKTSKSRRSVIKSVTAILEEAAGTNQGRQRPQEIQQDDEDDDDRIVERSDDIVDLLDPEAVSNVRTAASRRRSNAVSEDPTPDFSTAPDGRLILFDKRQEKRSDKPRDDYDDDDDDSLQQADVLSGIQLKSVKSAKSARSRTSQKTDASQNAKTRKSNGKSDAKKRGERFEPFAYVTLDRRSLNKRKKAKLSGRFENLVKSAKRGAASGSKANATSTRKLKRAGRSEVRAQTARGNMDFD